MKSFPLSSDRVSLAVTETGGHLSDIVFTLPGGRRISPMHVAPWFDETLAADTPPILKVLRGDFFCAPFGGSDVIAGETRVHGLAANGDWRLRASGPGFVDAVLDGDVMGATVGKHVAVRPGETVIYQRHTLSGGTGRLPIGHHAMLKAESPLQLAFAPLLTALTPPEPVEVPPLGRPLLAQDQVIADIHRARRADGGTVDLTMFPSPDGFEAIWMAVTDPAQSLGWSAATAAKDGWVWFGIKDRRVLPETLLWFSNGGRDYPPWNGRHRRVIGIEGICGYFHVSHAASIADNPVAAMGIPTAVTLGPARPVVVSYVFGLAAIPPGFAAVQTIAPSPGGVTLADTAGREAFSACDLSFVTG